MVSNNINELVQAAMQAANAGQWQDAERLWRDVLKEEPAHPQALCSLGIHALQRGDLKGGVKQLQAARAGAPNDLFILMTLVDVYRKNGEAVAERETIDAALAVDPYFVPALLARANWLEHFGSPAEAATVYKNALRISPPEKDWPQAYRSQLEYAKSVVEKHTAAFDEYLTDKMADLTAGLPADLSERWAEATAIRSGRTKPYVSDSNQLYVPRLPAIPFFQRSQFPFLDALEAKTDIIREEILAVLASERDCLTPYIAYKPGQPVNQWQELDHSKRWSALQLWRGGNAVEENLSRCPETARALAAVSMADLSGLSPNALFSALAPKTHIPPHHGESNARVIAHLPLIVPGHCKLRVGFEEREWEAGKCLIFDDTLEHEARNDSDELRVVLIFDLWNPLLDEQEKALVNRLAQATRDYSRMPATP